MTEPLRVVLAEDSYLVREGTRRLLEDSGEIEVVAAVGNAEELVAAVERLAPDAVITDIRMPPGHGTEGIEAARLLRREHPGLGVVVLSQYSDAAYATELFRDGTEGLGYLLKVSIGELDEILAALRAVVAGRSVVDPGVVERLVEDSVRQVESPLRSLSAREIDVLREMAEGRTNAAIGARLHLSESAIEKYINAIFTKLALGDEPGVSRRVAAVLAYLRDPAGGASDGFDKLNQRGTSSTSRGQAQPAVRGSTGGDGVRSAGTKE
ncbi:MAG: response regulator transcription factor [Nocardioidaceae bacterium]